MENVKSWLLWKGVWGGLVTLGAGLAGLFGYSFPAEAQALLSEDLYQLAVAGTTVVGGALAVWGRLKAAKKIG